MSENISHSSALHRFFQFFSLALYKSTYSSDMTQHAAFICCIDSEFAITEELLSLVLMKGTTTGKDLFDAILKVMIDLNLDYKLLKGITTNGAPSMMGIINGLTV